MSYKSKVLIASSSLSQSEYIPVADKLMLKGYEPVIYKADKVLSGEEEFTLNISRSGTVNVTYEGVDISPEKIGASWYRKVSDFDLRGKTSDKASLLLLQEEIGNFHEAIWPLFDVNKWLNPPEQIYKASRKLGQLLVAREVGFNIPDSMVTSSWKSIQNHFFKSNDIQQIALKMIRGVIIENNIDKALSTTILDANKVKDISSLAVPFPGLYQEYLDKAREWRITVVGEDVYPISIYTSEAAKDDWRKHQMKGDVIFKSEQISQDISEKCIKYLGRMGLGFGAFDFVEKSDGEIVFLECNANGQYYAFEERFNLPISQSIASELMKIAESN